jgi:hypothetical protein
MTTEMPTPTIIADVFEPNPLSSMFDSMSLGTLRRIYSTPGFPPLRLQLSMRRDPEPWRVQIDVLRSDGEWKVMLFSNVPPQDGYGETLADCLAGQSIRLLAEARAGAA